MAPGISESAFCRFCAILSFFCTAGGRWKWGVMDGRVYSGGGRKFWECNLHFYCVRADVYVNRGILLCFISTLFRRDVMLLGVFGTRCKCIRNNLRGRFECNKYVIKWVGNKDIRKDRRYRNIIYSVMSDDMNPI